ncbi:polysaccharide lyase family 1 protein [Micromonospora sp. BRA006-A]|nr:polysaccharide lyase family 1 protein [Micromonospora sp. BRA006-A]
MRTRTEDRRAGRRQRDERRRRHPQDRVRGRDSRRFRRPGRHAAGLCRPGRPGYSLPAYLAAYDPATWGRVNPSGPLEAARVRSVAEQTRQTQINVGSNTTIVGLRGARLTGLTLMIDRVDNVIVRNIEFADARDCFPAWSPTDGDTGNWNSQYDQISVRRSEHVWIDHNTFTDGDNPDSAQPVHFGRPYQVHDGSVDVTHTASLVTVSWNRFTGRDKVMLIGSSNTVGPDVGRLNVTVRHNLFDGTLQRLPRVRFGQVDVHENHYRLGGPGFAYALGVGVRSALYAENNFFTLTGDTAPADLLYDWGGTALTERGSWVRQGDRLPRPVDLRAAYNAAHDPDLGGDAGWTPTLRAAGRCRPRWSRSSWTPSPAPGGCRSDLRPSPHAHHLDAVAVTATARPRPASPRGRRPAPSPSLPGRRLTRRRRCEMITLTDIAAGEMNRRPPGTTG